MMKSKIVLDWIDGLAFETNVNGHKMILDADDAVGGENRGPRPKPLLLVSLGGCTAMDVISILKKMRVEVKKFDVIVDGELTGEHPKHYEKIHIIYEFRGKDLPMDKLEKAVTLSQERYCGVSHTLKNALALTWEIRVIDKE